MDSNQYLPRPLGTFYQLNYRGIYKAQSVSYFPQKYLKEFAVCALTKRKEVRGEELTLPAVRYVYTLHRIEYEIGKSPNSPRL